MNDEELKKKIEEIIGFNIWFDGGGSLHYDYGDMMEQLLELFHKHKNSSIT